MEVNLNTFKKKKIVFVSEMGEGLGHVSRLLIIAENLRKQGYQCIFLVSDLRLAGAKAQQSGFDVIAAPNVRLSPLRQGEQTKSIADILMRKGYADDARLENALGAWKSILKFIDPDLVVLDYAPTARLAAGEQFKTIVIGTGFTIPASVSGQIAKYRKGKPLIPEVEILNTIARVQKNAGGWIPRQLIELLRGDRVFLTVLPEMDCFSCHRKEKLINPLVFPETPVTTEPVKDIFCYLNGHNPKISNLLKSLQSLGLKGGAYLKNIDPEKAKSLTTENFLVFSEAQDINSIARSTKFIVHHGGIGLSQHALGLGRPQILLPNHMEQYMNAANLMRLGSAELLRNWSKANPDNLSQAIYSFVQKTHLLNSAYDLAKNLTEGRKASLNFVLSECINVISLEE